MATLSTIVAEINSALPSDWQKTDAAGSILMGSGAGLPLHGSPPRVVWVLGREPIRKPVAGRIDDRGIIWVRHTVVDLYLWGETIAQVDETMIPAAIRAIHLRAGNTAYDFPGPGTWTQAADLIQSGVLYVLPVELAIPVRRTDVTTAGPSLALPTTMQLRKSDGATYETSHTQQVP